VRLVDEEGEQVGVVSLDEARDLAADRNLDMVEVAPNARPPVVRLMDYGRFKYEQAKAEKEAKKRQHTVEVKEVKFRPKIDEHDFQFKKRNAERFLRAGNKVKSTVVFRGREMAHNEVGLRILRRLAAELTDVAQVESPPRQEGITMIQYLAPKKGEGGHAKVKKAKRSRAEVLETTEDTQGAADQSTGSEG